MRARLKVGDPLFFAVENGKCFSCREDPALWGGAWGEGVMRSISETNPVDAQQYHYHAKQYHYQYHHQ